MGITARIESPLIRVDERYGERIGLDRLEVAIPSAPHAAKTRREVDGVEGDVPTGRFMVGTSAAGLLRA